MKWTKASEPVKGNHADTLIVRLKGKKRLIENRYGEYWVWQTDREKEIRVYDNQWNELEYFDESPPASAVEEAERLYPCTSPIGSYDRSLAETKKEAHITCAGMYTGEIEKGREAIDILKALCALKKHKDTVGKDEYYEKAQPEVWKIANKFLEKHNL